MVSLQDITNKSNGRRALTEELIRRGDLRKAESFHDCGDAFIACRCQDCGQLNTFDVSCHISVCRRCSGTKAYRTVQRYERLVDAYDNPLRLDLTVENEESLSVDDLRELRNYFYRMRDRINRMDYAEKREVVLAADIDSEKRARYLSSMSKNRGRMQIKGGMYAFETTYSASKGWNHHIHLIIDAPYIPQPLLSEIWRQESGSSIVYIQAIVDKGHLENSMAYILKYMSKPPSIKAGEKAEVVSKAINYVLELEGFRRWGTFGSLYDISPEDLEAECEFCGSEDLEYFAHSRSYSDWSVGDEFPDVEPGGAAA